MAKRDGHQVSAAKVVLAYRDDEKELASAGVDRADGVFRFEFVPEGDYVIKTEDARDVVWESVKNTTGMFPPTLEKERLVTSYGTAEQPLLLRGEMSDVRALGAGEVRRREPGRRRGLRERADGRLWA